MFTASTVFNRDEFFELPPSERNHYIKSSLLINADFSDLILRDFDLTNLDLRSCNLSEANLTRADLQGTNLTGVCLTGASLRWTNLRYAFLDDVDLKQADIRNCIGNNTSVFTMQLKYDIVYHVESEQLAIGCEQMSLKEWLALSLDELNALDDEAHFDDPKYTLENVVIPWIDAI